MEMHSQKDPEQGAPYEARDVQAAENSGSSRESSPSSYFPPAPITNLKIDRDAVVGCLLGTAVGDSIGLPFEGLSARRQSKILRGPLRHQLLFGRGMVSDDTEHAAMLVQALIESKGELPAFKRSLARRIKNWIALMPAGIGLGTLKAGLKLWSGFSADKSGVKSAGNGPCMRSPVLGVIYGDDLHKLLGFVEASTRITHTDERATAGALAVAVAAHYSSSTQEITPQGYRAQLEPALLLTEDREIAEAIEQAIASVEREETTREFALSLGLERGVTGFVLHTVPVVIHAWLRNPKNFEAALTDTITCGGDTDTTGAIVGAIVGARVKEAGLPSKWVDGIKDPCVNPSFLKKLSSQLLSISAPSENLEVPRINPLKQFGRNMLFLATVLSHGFRRLLPPY